MSVYPVTQDFYEQLEVKVDNDGDRIALVQRQRTRAGEAWNIKVIILNRREAEQVADVISARTRLSGKFYFKA